MSKYCIGTLWGTRLRLPQIGTLFSEDKQKWNNLCLLSTEVEKRMEEHFSQLDLLH